MSVSVQPGVLGQQAILSRRSFSRRRAQLRWNFAAGAFLFLVLALQLSVRVVVTEKGYLLEQTRELALQNDINLRHLNLEYAYVSRPAETARVAEDRLGMAALTPQRMRKLLIVEGRTE